MGDGRRAHAALGADEQYLSGAGEPVAVGVEGDRRLLVRKGSGTMKFIAEAEAASGEAETTSRLASISACSFGADGPVGHTAGLSERS